MTPLAVVFPDASRKAGVERVTLDFCNYMARLRPVSFVGTSQTGLDGEVHWEQVRESRLPGPGAPIGFRRNAGQVLETMGPHIGISNGVNCPPTDVAWVHSVHRAYLESTGRLRAGSFSVPGSVRRLLPIHQVLMRLEQSYFTSGRQKLFICTSPREVDDIVTLYGVDRRLTSVVPNGFDPAVFNPQERMSRRGAMRTLLGYSKDDTVLLLAANEWHRKGLDVTLRALAARRGGSVKLLLVGRTPLGSYQGMIDNLGLSERVHYAGSTSALIDYLAACDVLVLPTQYEPFGLVVVEALGSGVPVIVSRLAGAADAVGQAGVLLDDPFSAEELADLIGMAANREVREAWKVATADSARDYTWAHLFNGVLEQLSTLDPR